MSPPPEQRPELGATLDRWVRRLGRLMGPLLGRPTDIELTELARHDRPAPPIEIPAFGPDHLAEGRQALADGRHGEALHAFGTLLADDPDHAWAWHGRGDALQLLGDPAAALEAYSRAAHLQPRTGLHHGGRANALRALGEDDTGAWAMALHLDPDLTWMRPG